MATVPFPLAPMPSYVSRTNYLIGISDNKGNLVAAVNPAKIVAILPAKNEEKWLLYVDRIENPITLAQSQAERIYQQLGQG